MAQLSDPGAEKALYYTPSMRAFAGLKLGRGAVPATAIHNIRHLIERHELTKAVFAAIAEHLGARVHCCAATRSLLAALVSGRG